MKKLMTIIGILALLVGCNCDPCGPDDEDAADDVLEDVLEENDDDGITEDIVEDSTEDVAEEENIEDAVEEEAVDDVIEDSVDDSDEEVVSTCMTDSECNEWCIDHECRTGGGCFEFADEEAGICTCPAARSECECYD